MPSTKGGWNQLVNLDSGCQRQRDNLYSLYFLGIGTYLRVIRRDGNGLVAGVGRERRCENKEAGQLFLSEKRF